MFKIYFVEDEMDLAKLVTKYLTNENYQVKVFYSGEEAMKHIHDEVDLWILDIMLTGNINGYDLIKKIKERKNSQPVIFTSARDQDIDKIMGLELGSDDYVAKPYSPRELILRCKAILKRSYQDKFETVIKYQSYDIDLTKRIVIEEQEIINLTTKEYDLLIFLVNNRKQAFSREQILNQVWGTDYFGSDRVVDDLMRRLRIKLPNLRVETIYGYGYRLL